MTLISLPSCRTLSFMNVTPLLLGLLHCVMENPSEKRIFIISELHGACGQMLASHWWGRVRVSVSPYGFHSARNGVWLGFSRDFSCFPLTQIPFQYISALISLIQFNFNSSAFIDTSGVVGRHPCYSLTFNKGASSHLIRRPGTVSGKS